jgi:hypothetical protein
MLASYHKPRLAASIFFAFLSVSGCVQSAGNSTLVSTSQSMLMGLLRHVGSDLNTHPCSDFLASFEIVHNSSKATVRRHSA